MAQGPAQEVAAARRAEPLRDLLGDLAAGQVGRQHAGGRGAAGRGRSVRDDDRALQPEQRGPAVGLGVQPLGELAQAAPLQQRPEPGRPGAGERLAQLPGGEAGGALERLQGHVAGEAVGHDHVDLAGQQVAALDVAGEADRQAAVRRVGVEQLIGAPGQLVALARLGADGEQADPRLGDAEGGLRVGHAELGELDQHLRLGVGDRARVEQQRGRGPGGQHDRQRGAQHPGSGRSRSLAVATMAPVEPADITAAAWPRRTSWQATAMLDRGRRQLASAPSSIAIESSAGTIRDVGQRAVGGEQRAQQARAAGQQHRMPIAGGRDRARHDLVRARDHRPWRPRRSPRGPGPVARRPPVRRLAARRCRRAAPRLRVPPIAPAQPPVPASRSPACGQLLTARRAACRRRGAAGPGRDRGRPVGGRRPVAWDARSGEADRGRSGNLRRRQNVCQVGDLRPPPAARRSSRRSHRSDRETAWPPGTLSVPDRFLIVT